MTDSYCFGTNQCQHNETALDSPGSSSAYLRLLWVIFDSFSEDLMWSKETACFLSWAPSQWQSFGDSFTLKWTQINIHVWNFLTPVVTPTLRIFQILLHFFFFQIWFLPLSYRWMMFCCKVFSCSPLPLLQASRGCTFHLDVHVSGPGNRSLHSGRTKRTHCLRAWGSCFPEGEGFLARYHLLQLQSPQTLASHSLLVDSRQFGSLQAEIETYLTWILHKRFIWFEPHSKEGLWGSSFIWVNISLRFESNLTG